MTESSSPETVSPNAQQLLELMPLAATLQIQIDSAHPDEVIGRMDWAAERCTAGGVLHGGSLVSLADCMAGICAHLNLPAGASTSTVELKVNYFAAVRAGTVIAIARPLHRGRTFTVVQTDLYRQPPGGATGDSDRNRVAQITQTQAVLGG